MSVKVLCDICKEEPIFSHKLMIDDEERFDLCHRHYIELLKYIKRMK